MTFMCLGNIHFFICELDIYVTVYSKEKEMHQHRFVLKVMKGLYIFYSPHAYWKTSLDKYMSYKKNYWSIKVVGKIK